MPDLSRTRRRFLRLGASLGAFSVAGCLNRGAEGVTDGTPTGMIGTTDGSTDTRSPVTPSSTDITTPTPTPQRTPVSVPFRWTVEVLNRHPTAEEPPRIQISVTNEGGEAHSLTTPSHNFPFTDKSPGAAGDPMDTFLVLTNSTSRVKGCWTGDVYDLPSHNGERFEPGDSATVEYDVVNKGQDGGDPEECWPVETFTFWDHYYLDSSDPTRIDGEEFRWGFKIHVEDPPAVHATKLQPFRT